MPSFSFYFKRGNKMLFFILFIFNFANSQVLENCIDKEKYKYEYFFNGTTHYHGTDLKLNIFSQKKTEIYIQIPHLNLKKKIVLMENQNIEEYIYNYNQSIFKSNYINTLSFIENNRNYNINKNGLFIFSSEKIICNIISECHTGNRICGHFSSFTLLSNRDSGIEYSLVRPKEVRSQVVYNIMSYSDNNYIKYQSFGEVFKGEFTLMKGENIFIRLNNNENINNFIINSKYPISVSKDYIENINIINSNNTQIIFPNKLIGYEYLLVPFEFEGDDLISTGFYYHITPLEDNTNVYINDILKGNYNRENYLFEYSEEPLYLKSNKNINVYQYNYSYMKYAFPLRTSRGGFVQCLPIDNMKNKLNLVVFQNFDNATCNGNNSNNDKMFCNIIKYKNNHVYINKNNIEEFKEFNNPEFSFKSISLDKGVHLLESDTNIISYIYGYKAKDNNSQTLGFYYYTTFQDFNNPDTYIEINNRYNLEFLCNYSPFILSADAPEETKTFHWTINDTLEAEGKEVDLHLPEPGKYDIKLKLDNDDEQIYEWAVTRLEKISTDLDSVIYLCNDSLKNIEMNVTGGGTSKSITWFPNENIKDPTQFNIEFISPISETQTFYYEITDEHCCSYSDSVRIEITKVYPTITTTKTNFCEGDSATLSLDKDYETIIWNTGETTQDIVVKESGVYSATVTEGNCTNDTSIVINVNPLPIIEIEAPDGTILCDGGSIEIEAKVPAGTQIQWENNSRLPKRTINQSGTYTITATNIATGCKSEKSIEVTDIDNIEAEIIGDTTFCDGESTTLTIQPQGKSYLWSNGETTQSIEVNESGIYSATITTEAGCEVWAEKEVEKLPLPEFEILGEKIICDNEVEIYPDQDFEKYEWSTGESSKTITIETAGTYELTVIDENGCQATREVTIIENDPTLNLSSYNIDFGEIIFGEQRTETITADKEVILTKNTTLFNVAINSTQINITFNPDNIGTYEDYIIVESIGDCKASRTITITGICKAEILASVSNSEGYPGDNVSNQVSLELLQQIPLPIEFNYEITLSTNQDAIRITDATTFDYANGKLIIDLNNYIFKEEQKTDLDPINSKIMLAKNLDNPLEITHFTTDNEYLIPLRQNGNIKIYEICIYEERLIEYYNPAQIQKISKTEMKLSTYYAGKYEIEIADITGKTISKQSRTTNKDESIEFNYNLSNGTYIIKITEPGKTQTRKIVFVE